MIEKLRRYVGDLQGGHFRDEGVDCYRTGDIGCIEDGLLFCKGRRDSQIKYMGYRIELGEIEYHINSMADVRSSAVIARYDNNGAVKAIRAYVEAENSIDSRRIKTELKKYLPYYMIPKTVKIIEHMPLNTNGKIDRSKLRTEDGILEILNSAG